MVQQHVALAHRVEDVRACLASARGQRRARTAGYLRSGRSTSSGICISRTRFTGPSTRYRSVSAQPELLQQEVASCRRTVVGHFQAHRVAEMALRQFALQRRAQVLRLLPRRRTGRCCASRGTGSSPAPPCRRTARPRARAGSRTGTRTRTRQPAISAAAGSRAAARAAPARWRRATCGRRRRLPSQLDGEVQALVEHARERMRGIEADRRQHRHHLAEEVVPDPRLLRGVPVAAAQKPDAFARRARDQRLR